MDSAILGIDIGGTKTASALITLQGEILERDFQSTGQQGYTDGFHQLSTAVKRLLQSAAARQLTVQGIGIGIPAALEKGTDRILWAPNIAGWENVDLRGDLMKKFGIPVSVEYDGHTAVMGEWWMGAGRGMDSLIDIVIGTGIGSGAIIDGHLIRGENRLAGAIGWQVIGSSADTKGATGWDEQKKGAWESLAAGPGIAGYANANLSESERKLISNGAETVDSKQVFAAAQAGYPPAVRITDRIAEWLGIGIANVISTLNPRVVILGGSVGSACGFLLPKIEKTCAIWAQPVSAKTAAIKISTLGTDAGILGAAYGILLRNEQ